MTQPTNTNLVFTFYFTSGGAPYDPSPAPTLTLEYPDHTFLSPAPTLTRVRTGEWSYTALAVANTQRGAYVALASTTDTAVDGYPFPISATWEVGTNDVASIVAALFAYLLTSVTTAGSWAKYVYDTLATILSRTTSGVEFISPVAQDGLTTTLYIARDYLVTNRQQLDYGIDDLQTDDVITWSVARLGSTPLEVTGTYVLVGSQPTARVQVTAAQTATLGGYIGTQVLEILITNAVGNKSERLVGRAVVKNVNVLTPS